MNTIVDQEQFDDLDKLLQKLTEVNMEVIEISNGLKAIKSLSEYVAMQPRIANALSAITSISNSQQDREKP